MTNDKLAATLHPGEEWMRGGWIQTFTGRQFWPLSPRVEDLDVRDIAHSLALQCRYNGHVDRFYSVAEHSVLISHAVPAEDALWGLLHDGAETYVGDMVRPLKRDLPEFAAAENRILALFPIAFDLDPAGIPASVHEADNRILLTERAELLSATRVRWDESLEQMDPLPVEIVGWSPEISEAKWMQRFEELTS